MIVTPVIESGFILCFGQHASGLISLLELLESNQVVMETQARVDKQKSSRIRSFIRYVSRRKCIMDLINPIISSIIKYYVDFYLIVAPLGALWKCKFP